MSQIFDALHRSETDRQGMDTRRFAAATDLLEAAERNLALGSPKSEPTTTVEKRGLFSLLSSVRVVTPTGSKIVFGQVGESLAAEKFRYLSVRLRHVQQKRTLRRLLITSSMPEEGKSTVAANLACTLATKQKQNVLLLEGDIRRPTLAQQFGLQAGAGLRELLEGDPCPDMNICRLDGLGLYFLRAGKPASDPLVLLQSENLPVLMDQLSSWFDWIVIDSPPVLPLADTSVWMRLTDAILLVTRPGKTAKKQLQRSLEVLEQSKLVGALVNGSQESLSSAYYYYGGRQAELVTAGEPS